MMSRLVNKLPELFDQQRFLYLKSQGLELRPLAREHFSMLHLIRGTLCHFTSDNHNNNNNNNNNMHVYTG